MPAAFEGQIALVTGASRGIGAATAEALAREGAHVILTARTATSLEEVEERIHLAGGSATIAPLDLTDGDSIGKLATALSGRWDALDIMVLNAAMLGTLTPVAQMCAFIHADSLAFVSIEGLYKALGESRRDARSPQYCDACFTGDYPTTLTDFDDLTQVNQLELLSERVLATVAEGVDDDRDD